MTRGRCPFPTPLDSTLLRSSDHNYTVRATISAHDRLLWTTDINYPVITRDNPTTADLLLVAVPEPVSD